MLKDAIDRICLVVRVVCCQVKWGVEDAVLDLVLFVGTKRGEAKGVDCLALKKREVGVDGTCDETCVYMKE
jgi:hypothetical protein